MKHLLLSTLLLISSHARAAEVSVNSIVDRNQVGMGDVINLTVQVTSSDSIQVEEPRVPPLSGFELINTSSSNETRSSFINGKFQTAQTRNFTYMLAIQQKGILTIPEIPITVEGKTYKTQPIKISATSARAAPQGQPPQQARRGRGQGQGQAQGQADPFQQMDEMEEIFNQMLQKRMAPQGGGGGGIAGQPGGPAGQVQPPVNADEAFFISAETDKTKSYVGEQITVGFYLYTRGQIRDIDTLKYPDLKGFWKEEIEMATRLNFEQVNVNGLVYSKALLVSYALFPIKAGKSIIDPYKAKCTVVTPSNFGFGRPYQFTKASRPINIEVLDVPANNRPANYSGAVGHFRLSGQFEPPTGTVNQPVTLRLRFEGKGNAKLIELPKMDLPASFEFYDQKNNSKFLKDGTSFKEFEVLIIPREPGVFNVNPVKTSVFDPASQKYSEISTQALNITVTGSATSPAAPTLPQANSPAKTDKAAATPATLELPNLSTDVEGPVVSAGLLTTVTGALYVFVFGLLAWRGFVSLRRKPKRVGLKILLKRRSKAAREFAAKNEFRKVGVELTNATNYILGQVSEQGGANMELNALLEHTPPSLREELSGKIQKMIAQCEALSFAPEKMIVDLTSQPKLEALITEFEAVMGRAIELAEI